MHKLGILGLGSKSTLFYIDELNYQYNKLHGGYSTCPFVMINTDFNAINSSLPDNFYKLKHIVKPYLDYFESLDIECLLIPNITLHETIDMLIAEESYSFKVIHPLKLVIDNIAKQGVKEIVVFGSVYTMTQKYISGHIASNTVSVYNLDGKKIETIDEIRKQIYIEDYSNVFKLEQIINELPANITPVIACTELSIALKNTNRKIDMAQLQIKDALNQITDKNESRA